MLANSKKNLSCYFTVFIFVDTTPCLDYLLYAIHSDIQYAVKDVVTKIIFL